MSSPLTPRKHPTVVVSSARGRARGRTKLTTSSHKSTWLNGGRVWWCLSWRRQVGGCGLLFPKSEHSWGARGRPYEGRPVACATQADIIGKTDQPFSQVCVPRCFFYFGTAGRGSHGVFFFSCSFIPHVVALPCRPLQDCLFCGAPVLFLRCQRFQNTGYFCLLVDFLERRAAHSRACAPGLVLRLIK